MTMIDGEELLRLISLMPAAGDIGGHSAVRLDHVMRTVGETINNARKLPAPHPAFEEWWLREGQFRTKSRATFYRAWLAALAAYGVSPQPPDGEPNV